MCLIKKERHPNLEEEQAERARIFRDDQKAIRRNEYLTTKAAEKERFAQKELQSYA